MYEVFDRYDVDYEDDKREEQWEDEEEDLLGAVSDDEENQYEEEEHYSSEGDGDIVILSDESAKEDEFMDDYEEEYESEDKHGEASDTDDDGHDNNIEQGALPNGVGFVRSELPEDKAADKGMEEMEEEVEDDVARHGESSLFMPQHETTTHAFTPQETTNEFTPADCLYSTGYLEQQYTARQLPIQNNFGDMEVMELDDDDEEEVGQRIDHHPVESTIPASEAYHYESETAYLQRHLQQDDRLQFGGQQVHKEQAIEGLVDPSFSSHTADARNAALALSFMGEIAQLGEELRNSKPGFVGDQHETLVIDYRPSEDRDRTPAGGLVDSKAEQLIPIGSSETVHDRGTLDESPKEDSDVDIVEITSIKSSAVNIPNKTQEEKVSTLGMTTPDFIPPVRTISVPQITSSRQINPFYSGVSENVKGLQSMAELATSKIYSGVSFTFGQATETESMPAGDDESPTSIEISSKTEDMAEVEKAVSDSDDIEMISIDHNIVSDDVPKRSGEGISNLIEKETSDIENASELAKDALETFAHSKLFGGGDEDETTADQNDLQKKEAAETVDGGAEMRDVLMEVTASVSPSDADPEAVAEESYKTLQNSPQIIEIEEVGKSRAHFTVSQGADEEHKPVSSPSSEETQSHPPIASQILDEKYVPETESEIVVADNGDDEKQFEEIESQTLVSQNAGDEEPVQKTESEIVVLHSADQEKLPQETGPETLAPQNIEKSHVLIEVPDTGDTVLQPADETTKPNPVVISLCAEDRQENISGIDGPHGCSKDIHVGATDSTNFATIYTETLVESDTGVLPLSVEDIPQDIIDDEMDHQDVDISVLNDFEPQKKEGVSIPPIVEMEKKDSFCDQGSSEHVSFENRVSNHDISKEPAIDQDGEEANFISEKEKKEPSSNLVGNDFLEEEKNSHCPSKDISFEMDDYIHTSPGDSHREAEEPPSALLLKDTIVLKTSTDLTVQRYAERSKSPEEVKLGGDVDEPAKAQGHDEVVSQDVANDAHVAAAAAKPTHINGSLEEAAPIFKGTPREKKVGPKSAPKKASITTSLITLSPRELRSGRRLDGDGDGRDNTKYPAGSASPAIRRSKRISLANGNKAEPDKKESKPSVSRGKRKRDELAGKHEESPPNSKAAKVESKAKPASSAHEGTVKEYINKRAASKNAEKSAEDAFATTEEPIGARTRLAAHKEDEKIASPTPVESQETLEPHPLRGKERARASDTLAKTKLSKKHGKDVSSEMPMQSEVEEEMLAEKWAKTRKVSRLHNLRVLQDKLDESVSGTLQETAGEVEANHDNEEGRAAEDESVQPTILPVKGKRGKKEKKANPSFTPLAKRRGRRINLNKR